MVPFLILCVGSIALVSYFIWRNNEVYKFCLYVNDLVLLNNMLLHSEISLEDRFDKKRLTARFDIDKMLPKYDKILFSFKPVSCHLNMPVKPLKFSFSEEEISKMLGQGGGLLKSCVLGAKKNIDTYPKSIWGLKRK